MKQKLQLFKEHASGLLKVSCRPGFFIPSSLEDRTSCLVLEVAASASGLMQSEWRSSTRSGGNYEAVLWPHSERRKRNGGNYIKESYR